MGKRRNFRMMRGIVIAEDCLLLIIYVMKPIFIKVDFIGCFSGKYCDLKD